MSTDPAAGTLRGASQKGLSTTGREPSLGAMGDLAQNIIRPLVQKFVPGTVAISPFGPNMRSIVINVDPQSCWTTT